MSFLAKFMDDSAEKPNLRRCFDFLAHETYDKYVSFPENFAPYTCLPQAGLGLFERDHVLVFFTM
jgi:hypothetical protein